MEAVLANEIFCFFGFTTRDEFDGKAGRQTRSSITKQGLKKVGESVKRRNFLMNTP